MCDVQQVPGTAQLLTVRAGGFSHLCQALELRPGPEEVWVWLLLPQFHPVAVTVEVLFRGTEKENEALFWTVLLTLALVYPS